MLAELLDEAINILDEHNNIEETIRRANSLKRLLDELERLLSDLRSLVKFGAAFSACCADLDLTLPVKVINGIHQPLDEIVLKLDAAELEPLELSRLSRATSSLDEHLKAKWEGFVRKSSEDVLQLLEVIIPLVGEPGKAQTTAAIKSFLGKWPVSAEEVSSFTKAIEEGKQIIASLDVDNKIRNFLTLVANGSASLADLDDDVMNWLREHRLESRIVIRFKVSA
ncbi:Uncharacterized [Moorella glycerini]|uniref:Uncharacterized protein n=1 Tax=Neomoorella stamsii TaxID=1266720 RepID=A0A9X7P7I6_9FIRM|nr:MULTISPECIES: hypothetical protein [Moorella]PRR76749.1 hypothetical protein MOST_03930 [Moorella stamsii]CEP66717.1 Uncharacterized [Moorella glycerini]